MITFLRFITATTIITPLLLGSFSAQAVEPPKAPDCKCNESGFGVTKAREIAQCALYCTGKTGGLAEKPHYNSGDVANIIGNIINAILAFLGVAFMVLVVYAGGSWMFAGGDTEKVKTAKQILQSSLLGILIVVSAYVIMNFVFVQLFKFAFE